MESLRIKFIILACITLGSSIGHSKQRAAGVVYLNEFMSQIHQNPSLSSSSLTSIQCAQPMKLLNHATQVVPLGWIYIQAGEDKGFILRKHVSDMRPKCFQQKYSKFYNGLNLDLTELYFWGKLYDQIKIEETRAP